MCKFIRGMVLLMLVLITSCSSIGGLFSNDPCEGEGCDSAGQRDNSNTTQEWYCYGKNDGGEWQCENKRDRGKIVAIAPDNPVPAQAQPVSPTQPDVVRPAEIIAASSAITQSVNPAVGSERILQQPEDFYAVQLVAMEDEASVLSYASQNEISDPLYARISSQGKDWFVLLLGLYAEKSAATEANEVWMQTRNLKIKPWIRKLGPLQDAIRAAQ